MVVVYTLFSLDHTKSVSIVQRCLRKGFGSKLLCSAPSVEIGRCPGTVRPVFPVLVFQLSKQQNRTRATSSTVLGTPPNRTRTEKLPLNLRPVAFLVGLSTENPLKIDTFTTWNHTQNRTRTIPDQN